MLNKSFPIGCDGKKSFRELFQPSSLLINPIVLRSTIKDDTIWNIWEKTRQSPLYLDDDGDGDLCYRLTPLHLFTLVGTAMCSILHLTQIDPSNPICPLLAPRCYIRLWRVIYDSEFQTQTTLSLCFSLVSQLRLRMYIFKRSTHIWSLIILQSVDIIKYLIDTINHHNFWWWPAIVCKYRSIIQVMTTLFPKLGNLWPRRKRRTPVAVLLKMPS